MSEFNLESYFKQLGFDEKTSIIYADIFSEYENKPKEFRLLSKKAVFDIFSLNNFCDYEKDMIRISKGIADMIPHETIWVTDIEHTGKKVIAIGYAIMRLNWITGEVKVEKERELYIKRKRSDYEDRCWEEYWEGEKIISKEVKVIRLKEFKELQKKYPVFDEDEFSLPYSKTDSEIHVLEKFNDKMKVEFVTKGYPQRKQRSYFEENGKHESWVYQELINDFEAFCKKYNGKSYRVVGDHPGFDYGIINSDIKRIFNDKVEGLFYLRKWDKDGKMKLRHKTPCCIGSYYEGVNAMIYGPKESKKWFPKDIPEIKKILDTCPFSHDHMPVNDAKTMGWKYLKTKFWLYKEGYESLNDRKRKVFDIDTINVYDNGVGIHL